MNYHPLPPPQGDDVRLLAAYLFRELQKLAAVRVGDYEERHEAPAKPQAGMVRFADGTDWNPGGGKGLYFYDGTSWSKL